MNVIAQKGGASSAGVFLNRIERNARYVWKEQRGITGRSGLEGNVYGVAGQRRGHCAYSVRGTARERRREEMTGWDKLHRVEAYLDMQIHESQKGEAFHGYDNGLTEWYKNGNDLINEIIDNIPLAVNPDWLKEKPVVAPTAGRDY